jgi:hypothetical protein
VRVGAGATVGRVVPASSCLTFLGRVAPAGRRRDASQPHRHMRGGFPPRPRSGSAAHGERGGQLTKTPRPTDKNAPLRPVWQAGAQARGGSGGGRHGGVAWRRRNVRADKPVRERLRAPVRGWLRGGAAGTQVSCNLLRACTVWHLQSMVHFQRCCQEHHGRRHLQPFFSSGS